MSRASIQYLGCVWDKSSINLGDEAIFQAIRRQLQPFPLLRAAYRRRERWLWFRRNRIAMLGGGTLIGSAGGRRDVFREAFTRAARRSAMSVVFGAGVEPCRALEEGHTPPRWLVQWGESLADVDILTVRGPESAETLRSIGRTAEVVGDPALAWMQPADYWTPTPHRVGINIRFSELTYGTAEKACELMVAFVKTLSARGREVHFMIVSPGDIAATEAVARLTDTPIERLHRVYTDPQAYLGFARTFRSFVGTRLHSVVLAQCAGVPAAMLAYNPKCIEYMDSVGCGDWVLQLDRATPDACIAMLDALESRSDETRARFLAQGAHFHACQQRIVARLKAALVGG
jgi:polysaccharide pyruvyl transferase WcaK-like protein